ncbi:zinc finger protein 692 isoform X8 [Equus przewalskii]|uniref:Zinc finger protein 692 isoform X8 n=1 Tax=Equus przewalskii TaxID=9798 RepID=A0ABM4LQZ4_EQUPR|nr:zinc finger protein 692 isoform X4 [Equus caballus]
MHTAESAAWCLGCGGLGAEKGGLCGSAQQATPSPGAPLQAPHLQRSPGQSSFQVLPQEAGAQRPGAGRSLQVWNLSMMRGLRRPGCPGEEEEKEEDEDEEEMLSDASPWTYSSSPDEQVGAEGGCLAEQEEGGGSWSGNPELCRLYGRACWWRGQAGLWRRHKELEALNLVEGGKIRLWGRRKAESRCEQRSWDRSWVVPSLGSLRCRGWVGLKAQRECPHSLHSPFSSEPDAPHPPPSPVTHELKEGETSMAPEAPPVPFALPPSSASSLGSGAPLPAEVGVQLELTGTLQVAQQSQPMASPGSQSPSALASTWDEDTAQIGPKRIRKAAKRELLPCDFPGCGRIFSNRQYLNHHKKYQHIHQKSFSCPEPACGKSFNFKKHLKEHVKLHSDTRDYICEFCARSFRTSSNLIIHRRIHTGEKPLQCEICGFTCRQKASLNWHRRKHAETAATLRFPCEFCGKCFEKPDSVAAHRSKSHPTLHPAPQESPGLLEPCASISAPTPLGSSDGSRPSPVPQAPTLLPQQ